MPSRSSLASDLPGFRCFPQETKYQIFTEAFSDVLSVDCPTPREMVARVVALTHKEKDGVRRFEPSGQDIVSAYFSEMAKLLPFSAWQEWRGRDADSRSAGSRSYIRALYNGDWQWDAMVGDLTLREQSHGRTSYEVGDFWFYIRYLAYVEYRITIILDSLITRFGLRRPANEAEAYDRRQSMRNLWRFLIQDQHPMSPWMLLQQLPPRQMQALDIFVSEILQAVVLSARQDYPVDTDFDAYRYYGGLSTVSQKALIRSGVFEIFVSNRLLRSRPEEWIQLLCPDHAWTWMRQWHGRIQPGMLRGRRELYGPGHWYFDDDKLTIRIRDDTLAPGRDNVWLEECKNKCHVLATQPGDSWYGDCENNCRLGVLCNNNLAFAWRYGMNKLKTHGRFTVDGFDQQIDTVYEFDLHGNVYREPQWDWQWTGTEMDEDETEENLPLDKFLEKYFAD